MKTIFILLTVILCCSICNLNAQSVKELKRKSSKGDTEALFKLGRCYFYGEGVNQDYREAARLLQKSARQGSANAQYAVGICFYEGKGVPKNTTQAIYWFKQSVQGGNRNARDFLDKINGSIKQEDSFESIVETNLKVRQVEDDNNIIINGDKKEKRFIFGLRAGTDFSNIEGADVKFRQGFHFGVVTEAYISKTFSLEPGLYYVCKGFREYSTIDNIITKSNWSLGYIELPVLLIAKGKISDNASLRIAFGAFFAYGLYGQIKTTIGGKKADETIEIFGNNGDDGVANRFDGGLSFGAGIKAGKLFFGATYDLGLENIVKRDGLIEEMYGKDFKVQTRNLMVSVGVYF